MKKIIVYFLVLLAIGCKSEDKIEFYLLNKRAEIKEGIPYMDAITITDSLLLKEYEYVKYDTVFKTPIYSGRFEATSKDLQPEPFINNDEIISFNLENNKFIFTPAVARRIAELPGNMHIGTQFAITVNGKPKLTGYFMNFSVWCDWYYIRFWRKDQETELINETSFELYNGYMRGKHEDLTPPYPPELIEAFRSSRRLIE